MRRTLQIHRLHPTARVSKGSYPVQNLCAHSQSAARTERCSAQTRIKSGPLVPWVMLAAQARQTEGRHENMSRVGMDGSYAFEHISPGEYAVDRQFCPAISIPFDGITITPSSEDSQL